MPSGPIGSASLAWQSACSCARSSASQHHSTTNKPCRMVPRRELRGCLALTTIARVLEALCEDDGEICRKMLEHSARSEVEQFPKPRPCVKRTRNHAVRLRDLEMAAEGGRGDSQFEAGSARIQDDRIYGNEAASIVVRNGREIRSPVSREKRQERHSVATGRVTEDAVDAICSVAGSETSSDAIVLNFKPTNLVASVVGLQRHDVGRTGGTKGDRRHTNAINPGARVPRNDRNPAENRLGVDPD